MAVAGPLASIGISVIALGLGQVGAGWPPAIRGVLAYLGLINLVAGFNLIPVRRAGRPRLLAFFALKAELES